MRESSDDLGAWAETEAAAVLEGGHQLKEEYSRRKDWSGVDDDKLVIMNSVVALTHPLDGSHFVAAAAAAAARTVGYSGVGSVGARLGHC